MVRDWVREGRFREAETLLLRMLEARRAVFRGSHPAIASVLTALGDLHLEFGDPDRALALLQEALQLQRRSREPGHTGIARSLRSLARARLALGNLSAAEILLYESVDLWEAFDPHTPELVVDRTLLADVHLRQGLPDRARHQLELALDLASRHHMTGDEVALAKVVLAECELLHTGRLDLASTLLDEALQTAVDNLGGAHVAVAQCLHRKGLVARALGDYTQAECHLRDALLVLRSQSPPCPAGELAVLEELAQVSEARGSPGAARELRREGTRAERRLDLARLDGRLGLRSWRSIVPANR